MLKNAAGDFLLFTLKNKKTDVFKLKEITENYEESHILGRFIDVDVCDPYKGLISSGKLKKCFYCVDFSALDCAHNKRHSLQDLRDFQKNKMELYVNEIRNKELAKNISSAALRAILYEISLSPKPGLVDFYSNGIHKDMDFNLFIDSSAVLSNYFSDLFEAGFHFKSTDYSKALPIIRTIGLQMEAAMFLQTNGVNTQKGIIFLMGISLFTAGLIYKTKDRFNSKDFVFYVKNIGKDLSKNELHESDNILKTHGELCFRDFNTGGIRSEVENGFPSVFGLALPILAKSKINKVSLSKSLLAIMAELDDTTVLYRSNRIVLQELQLLSKECLDDFSDKSYQKIIDFCMKNKISPGGAADLLSISIFVYLLKDIKATILK